MNACAYSFHGLNLIVRGEDAVLTALHARLGRFSPGNTQEEAAGLHFEFHKVADDSRHVINRPPGPGRRVFDPGLGELAYFDESQQLYLEVPERGRALCDVNSRRVHVSYPESEASDPWLLAHLFFTVPLAELLKRRGLYMVHAAGLAVAGQGLLVAGQSGAGKTTLALALLRAGFDFLADDTVFLSLGKNGLRILAFPDEVDVTAQTLGFFPELQRLTHTSKPSGRLKQAICATSLYQVRPCWECEPEAIIFPQPGKSSRSILAPMPKPEALVLLVCNVLRTEPSSSQAHLDALARLVRNCRCYRLHTGYDFDRLPDLLRPVLEKADCLPEEEETLP
jgi:hypothetical protein